MTNAWSTKSAHNVNNNVSEKYDTSLDINIYHCTAYGSESLLRMNSEGMADLTEKKLVGHYLEGFEGHGIDLG